jgi:hypothetical protein
MTLVATDETPFRTIHPRWALPMRAEDGRIFRVFVTYDALSAIGAPTCPQGIPQLVGEYRLRIEEIASAKHAGGLIEQDGSILITQADVH